MERKIEIKWGGISNSAQRRNKNKEIQSAMESDVMLNEVLALSNAEVKHLSNTIKGDPSLRSG